MKNLVPKSGGMTNSPAPGDGIVRNELFKEINPYKAFAIPVLKGQYFSCDEKKNQDIPQYRINTHNTVP